MGRLSDHRKTLVLASYAADEIRIGGTIHKLIRTGQQVHVVNATSSSEPRPTKDVVLAD